MSELVKLPKDFPSDVDGMLVATRSMSLHQLVNTRKEIEFRVEQAGGELTPELEEVYDLANDLLAGKIDRVAIFVKEVIPAHIEACKLQIQKLQALEARTKELTIDAIKSLGEGVKQIEGLAYRARVQANPPSIVIDNEDVIPEMFKRGVCTIKAKFDPSGPARKFWEGICNDLSKKCGTAATGECSWEIETEPDNAILREAMLDKKDEDGEVVEKGSLVDGAHVEKGVHVRFEAGKAKASKVAGKTKKPKEIEQ